MGACDCADVRQDATVQSPAEVVPAKDPKLEKLNREVAAANRKHHDRSVGIGLLVPGVVLLAGSIVTGSLLGYGLTSGQPEPQIVGLSVGTIGLFGLGLGLMIPGAVKLARSRDPMRYRDEAITVTPWLSFEAGRPAEGATFSLRF